MKKILAVCLFLLASPVFSQVQPYLPAGAIDVRNFGVLCDGTTDNTSAFGRVATYAAAHSGSTIYFPPSVTPCMTSTNLSLPSNSTLWAYPGTATIKATAATTSSPNLIQVTGVSNVLVHGLILDGNLAGVPAAGASAVNTVYSSSNVVFENVTVQNTRAIGILFSTNVINSGVRNSTLNNVGNYWVTSGNNSDQQQGIVFCCGTSINTSATQGAPSATLTFTSTTGVVVGELVNGTTTPSPIPAGAYVVSLTGTTVTLNTATTSAMASGQQVNFSSNQGNFVNDNFLSSTGLDAISLSYQSDIMISRNVCVNVGGRLANGGACVYANTNRDVKIVDNITLGSFGNGLDTSLDYNLLIQGNTAAKSGSRNISVDSNINSNISDNLVYNGQQGGTTNGSGGINISSALGGTTSNLSIKGNIAYDDQPTKTQPYGISVNAGTTLAGVIYLGNDNLLNGNLTGGINAPTTVTSNVNYGYQSFQYGVSGTNNTGIGNGALESNNGFPITGSNNTGLGYVAGFGCIGCQDDTFVGSNTDPQNINGGGLTVVGSGALYHFAPGSVAYFDITAIGYQVGSTVCTGADHVLLLGVSSTTDCSGGTESGVIHIGAGSTDIIKCTGTLTPSTSSCVFAGSVTSVNGSIGKVRTVTAAGAITATAADYIICVNKTTGAASAVALEATPTTGALRIVKDCKGDASTNNITITPNAGNIDGSATYVINTAYGAVTMFYSGSAWDTTASR